MRIRLSNACQGENKKKKMQESGTYQSTESTEYNVPHRDTCTDD